jgi:alpha-D-xyloside xylohydrolase
MGVDFSWLDSCDVQPELPNYLGDGKDFAMTYGLMETIAIHDGYVRDWGDSRRMFALPRSSYAGMQRTGASMWSGDISVCGILYVFPFLRSDKTREREGYFRDRAI